MLTKMDADEEKAMEVSEDSEDSSGTEDSEQSDEEEDAADDAETERKVALLQKSVICAICIIAHSAQAERIRKFYWLLLPWSTVAIGTLHYRTPSD